MPEAWKKLGPLSQQRLLDHRQWFEKAPDERWFVQILGTDVSQAARVEALLAKGESLLGIGQFRVYSVEMRGSQRIGLIFGDFATEAEAKAAVKQLPLPLRVNNPYPRQVKRLR
jgi:septal ring-binding cell division protein DamX